DSNNRITNTTPDTPATRIIESGSERPNVKASKPSANMADLRQGRPADGKAYHSRHVRPHEGPSLPRFAPCSASYYSHPRPANSEVHPNIDGRPFNPGSVSPHGDDSYVGQVGNLS